MVLVAITRTGLDSTGLRAAAARSSDAKHARRPCLGRPRRDRLVGEPHRKAAALTQAGIVGRPVRHLALLRDVVTAVLVQLEWQDGHPELEEAIPYATQRLSTTARSLHHAISAPTSLIPAPP